MAISKGEKHSKRIGVISCFQMKDSTRLHKSTSRIDAKRFPSASRLRHQTAHSPNMMAPSPFSGVPSSIPFKWEEVPGKPKPDAINSIGSPLLQLPPRLSFSRQMVTSPDTQKHPQIYSKRVLLNRSRSKSFPDCGTKMWNPTYSIVSDKTGNPKVEEKDEKKESICEEFAESLSSPRSILAGFDSHSQASSSSPDVPVSPRRNYEFFAASPLRRSLSDVKNFEPSLTEEDINSNSGHIAVGITRNLFRLLHRKTKRSSNGRENSRCSTDSDLWSPTLATYLVRFEHDKIEKILHKKLQEVTPAPTPSGIIRPELLTPPPFVQSEIPKRRSMSHSQWFFNNIYRSYDLITTGWKVFKKVEQTTVLAPTSPKLIRMP